MDEKKNNQEQDAVRLEEQEMEQVSGGYKLLVETITCGKCDQKSITIRNQ